MTPAAASTSTVHEKLNSPHCHFDLAESEAEKETTATHLTPFPKADSPAVFNHMCSTFDPFLDDCLELAKRAYSLNVPIDLRVFEDLPHAFLNFAPLGPEFQHANQVCMHMVKRLFERQLTVPQSRPNSPCTYSSCKSYTDP
ncbi:unnamed protein product [Echinostoma caproni]|uniref:Abhydrolase_3 domain-containing protein n=1 Tax=Echinostoma caproni TaxID=27848 RepID=A0A183AW76_9TREM|nr:unnamed protein product [Echinostoma caproni]